MTIEKFTDSDMERILGLIRQISAMDEVEAIPALRHLLNTLTELAALPDVMDMGPDEGWHRRQFEEMAHRLNTQLERARAGLRDPRTLYAYQPLHLREAAEEMRRWIPKGHEGEYEPRFFSLQRTANEVALAVEYAIHRHGIGDALTRSIHSVTSRKSVLRAIEEARAGLLRLGPLTVADESGIRAAMERIAFYRTRKHLDEAEVAEAGGNLKKAAKLKAEAKVLLRQDWNEIFPEEAPPSPDSTPEGPPGN